MSLLIDAFLDDVSIFHVKVDVKSREIFTLLFFLSDERRWKEQGLNSKADFYLSFSSSSSMEALFFLLYCISCIRTGVHIISYYIKVMWFGINSAHQAYITKVFHFCELKYDP